MDETEKIIAEKVRRINSLREEISKMAGFLNLLEESDIVSTHSTPKNIKRNEFCEFRVESYLWTGSDNPRYAKCLSYDCRETMNELSKVMKPVLVARLESKRRELESMLK